VASSLSVRRLQSRTPRLLRMKEAQLRGRSHPGRGLNHGAGQLADPRCSHNWLGDPMERMARRGGEIQAEGSVRSSGSQMDWSVEGKVPMKAVKHAVVV
jgi:hypothetical protein